MHDRRDGSNENVGSPHSVWGIRLAAVLSVALVVSLIWAWIETFYRHLAVNAQLSFASSDKPYMPPPTIAKTILGNHYFGDFQLSLGYATNFRHAISPYLGPSLPTSYPPLSQFLFVPFSSLPLGISALTYLLISAAVFLVPLWLMLAPLKPEYRLIFLTPVAVLTTPFITFLDRGNDIGIVVGLIAWAIWAWRSERWVLCGTFLAAAIALKAYPAALLVVPLGLRRYKFTALVAASAVVVNLLALSVFAGGYFANIRAMLHAMQGGRFGPVQRLESWSAYSVIPNTAGLIFGRSSAHQLLTPGSRLMWLPSILYICGVYLVIRWGRVPQWCWGPLSLASIQLLVPVSFVYTTVWAPLGAVWFAWGYFVDLRPRESTRNDLTEWIALRIMLLLALVVTITPSVFTFSGTGGFEVVLTRYLSPALLMITLFTAIIHSLKPIKSESLPVSVE